MLINDWYFHQVMLQIAIIFIFWSLSIAAQTKSALCIHF